MKKSFKILMMLFVLVSLLALPGVGLAEKDTTGERIKKEGKDQTKEAVELEGMIVTATKTEHMLGDVPASVSVITKEEIKAANIESAADALRWVTGVRLKRSSWQPNKTTVSLLGLPSEYALVLINGQRVFGGGTGRGTSQSVDLEQYPAEMIERIEVVKGPASCLYGSEAVSGVINIITKSSPKKPSFFASTSYGTHDTRIYKASHGLTVDKFGYFLSYTRRESDGMDPKTDEFDADNVYANLSYDFTSSLKLTLQPSFYQQDDIVNEQQSETRSLNTILDWKPDELSKLSIRISGHDFDREWTSKAGMGKPAQKHEEENDKREAELNYSRPFFNINLITLGYQYFKEEYKYYLIDDKEQTMNSGFIQDEIDLDPFIITLGARMDHYDRWGTNFYPKAGLVYRASNDLKFKASIGKAFKAPTFGELYYNEFFMGGISWIRGNSDLDPEEAIGYQAGAEYRYKNLLMQCSLFRNDIKDMIKNYTIQENYKMGKPLWTYHNIEEAYTQGVEFNMVIDFTERLKGKMGYTFVDSEDETTGKDLTYTPEHDVIVELNYKESRYLPHINLRGEYVGKRYQNSENTEELGEYFLAHVKLSKTFYKHFKGFLSIENIFNTKYDEESEMPGAEFLGGVSVNF